MAHDQESVKAERNRHADLLVDDGQDGREPACLPRVKQQEDDVVFLHQLFKLVHRFEQSLLLLVAVRDGMARHRNWQHVALRFHHRINFLKPRGSDRCLEIVLSLTVLECEQALADGVAVAHLAIVDKGDVLVTPRQQVPCHLAPERS